MKPHLPLFLRKSIFSCLAVVTAFSLGCGDAWGESTDNPHNLVSGSSSLTWNTNAENKVFTNAAGEAAAFTQGDNVSFESSASVTLGENIMAVQVSIVNGADVVIDPGAFLLDFDTLALLGGSLQMGDSLSIGAGDTLAFGVNGSVLKSALVLGDEATLNIDFSGSGSATSLNNSTLTLQGGSWLQLSSCGSGDGKTYTLLTGVSGLVDSDGNELILDSSNNAISNYFDTTQPGTGFWKDSSLALTADGALQLVRHNEEVKEAITITSRQDGGANYQYYESVSFENISSTSSGGAIYGASKSTITLSNNGSVVFDGNIASDGGAIYGLSSSTIMLSNNGSVEFSGNTASGYSASGGAIYGGDDSTIMLSNNGSVEFNGNKSSISGGNYCSGGAICGGTIILSDNGSVNICRNSVSSFPSSYLTWVQSAGGAICGKIIILKNNAYVSFVENKASSSKASYGGAIYGAGYECDSITLSDNGCVTFSMNEAMYGGAIYGEMESTIVLNNNGSVEFSENKSSFEGGAVNGDTIVLSDNGSVVVKGNMASGYGGAIRCWHITLSNNGNVLFSRNTVSGSVYFDVLGGAVYTYGNLSIQNNDSVLFEKNAEVNSGTYRLRSVYAYNGDEISFSAEADKSIEFRDSVFIGSGSTVAMNADYTYQNEDGVSITVKQQGDILFTGKYTEQHLNELLEDAGAGRTATAEEILNSCTTEVNAMTNLYGGRLRVEDGAIYQGYGITAHEGSEATVLVKDAELSHVGYALEFNVGTALEVAGNSTIRGNVNLLADSLFKLEKAASLSLHETLEADAAELTVQGTALVAGSSTLNASLTLADGATLDMMSLDAGAVTLNGALTFGAQVEMGENLMAILNEMRGWEESVTLFTGIESLVLPQVVTSGDSGRVWVGDVFSNLAGNESYYIDFKADVGALLVVHVPEPTTTSLSLLVLAALAMRRRRG
ncbi:MAG: PEP-CTERM sorting domain-containing protein [Akkermansia sp.]|nr:PEP-CTERM sorting domain-containing protein [Akkermansia sp.]